MRVFLTALTFSAGAAYAEPPRVLTDIAPVQAIARAVMGDVASPDLLLPLNASPHHYAMKPSDAAKVSNADVVIWVGPKLSPWLADPLETLAPNATHMTLMEVAGTRHQEMREPAKIFDDHDHDHDDHDHDAKGHDEHKDHAHEHAEDDHKEHAHAEDMHKDHAHEGHDHKEHGDDHKEDMHAEDGHDDHKGHEEHAHDDHHGHHHSHEGEDPHVWLSPQNAKLWAGAIATVLSEKDPENAETYAQNAARFATDLGTTVEAINATLAPHRDAEFIVLHDAFGYFENAFDFPAHAVLHVGDEGAPGPRRVAKMRALVAEEGISCAFYDPGHGAAMIGAFADTGLRSAAVYPMGREGQTYSEILTSVADDMVSCLK